MLATSVALALGHHQAGRFQEAERLYHTSLAQEPNDFNAWYLLGILARQAGNYETAAKHLARAIELKPDWAEAHFDLGIVQQTQGNWPEAADSFCRATEHFPAHAEAHAKLAFALRHLGKNAEAIAAYRQVTQLRPNLAEGHNDLGEMLALEGKTAEALVCFQRAAGLKPDSAEIQNNIGNAFREQGEKEKAIAAFARAIVLRPELDATHNGLGVVYQEQGELDWATACFKCALELNPQNPFAWNNLGNVFKALGKIEAALNCFRRALALKPSFACAHSNLIYALHFCPNSDAAAIHAEHRRWNDNFAQRFSINIAPHRNDRSPNRRLRIGYVSPDFRDHCQSFFTLPLLTAHDCERFEIVCYSNAHREDHVTELLRSKVAGWRSIQSLSDDDAARLIRHDQIDILVDLTMHMARGRPLVFARKPAPVQVCWLAYPSTSGLSVIDYRLTDPHLDPPGHGDQHYSEISIRLHETFWCYDPLTTEPVVNLLPALTNDHITFGCLNNFCKVNTGVVKLWARVLRAVECSRLVLLAPTGSHREAVLDFFEREGIARDRVEFTGLRPRHDYLSLFHKIDISLDTIPYNGHTTSLDSLWMGVPVVTLVGDTAVGRAGLSQLMNMNLTEFIAQSPDQFVSIAQWLASDFSRLDHLRSTLRSRMEMSPLMDSLRFARHIEVAYRTIWQKWCATMGSEDSPLANTLGFARTH